MSQVYFGIDIGTSQCSVAYVVDTYYREDPDCYGPETFGQNGRSLTGLLLQQIGLSPPLPSRWDTDGS